MNRPRSLEDIGFYTLSDERAASASESSPLQRCELILTNRCNFACSYCRGLRRSCRGDMPIGIAESVVDYWVADGLQNVRFSGGEPTLYGGLVDLIKRCDAGGVRRIAVSTNGSADRELYDKLLAAGVNDVSISLDGCCAEDVNKMSGGRVVGDQVLANIRYLSKRCYVTVGVVVTDTNADALTGIIQLAADLGVSDIRIIPAAQDSDRLKKLSLSEDLLAKYPILKYRAANFMAGTPCRGLSKNDPHRCSLVLDDMAIAGKWHFPCIIHFREGGDPIGEIGPDMRSSRAAWAK